MSQESPLPGPIERAKTISQVFLWIRKSDLLDRLLYQGQKLRTERCPVHDGRWSGLEHPTNYCEHGCGFTGWLPEPEDKPMWPPGVFLSTSITTKDGAIHELRKDGKPYAPAPGEPSIEEARNR